MEISKLLVLPELSEILICKIARVRFFRLLFTFAIYGMYSLSRNSCSRLHLSIALNNMLVSFGMLGNWTYTELILSYVEYFTN